MEVQRSVTENKGLDKGRHKEHVRWNEYGKVKLLQHISSSIIFPILIALFWMPTLLSSISASGLCFQFNYYPVTLIFWEEHYFFHQPLLNFFSSSKVSTTADLSNIQKGLMTI